MSRHPNPIRSARPTRSLQFAVCSPSPESHPSLCRLIFACHAGHDDRVLETLLLIASVRAADTTRTGIVLAALWGHVLDVVGSRAIARRIQRLSTFALRRRLLPFATLCCSQRARKEQRIRSSLLSPNATLDVYHPEGPPPSRRPVADRRQTRRLYTSPRARLQREANPGGARATRRRFRMDIKTDTSYADHDRLLRMRLCVVQHSNSQRNPRAANRSRSFHCD